MLLGTVGKSCETMSMLDIQGVLLEGRMLSLRRACGGVEAVACGTARRGSNTGALLPGQNDWKAGLRTQERKRSWLDHA